MNNQEMLVNVLMDVMKARFSISKQIDLYPFTIQRNMVIACFAIHNFIRKYNIGGKLFMECNKDITFNIFSKKKKDIIFSNEE